MSEDTAQPVAAAESVDASILEAANAFKLSLGQAEPDRPRDDLGRFAPLQAAEPDDIEAEAPAEAESHDEEVTEEAAEEAQPDPVDLPTSWPREHAETWKTLPAEAQAIIAEREAQRDAAVNAKFQEAANVRKANEAVIAEANANRERFEELGKLALTLIAPQEPPVSMLDQRSSDYNPDEYHLRKAQYDQSVRLVSSLHQQLSQAEAQRMEEGQREREQFKSRINAEFEPLFLKEVPELSDPARQQAVVVEIAQYAMKNGIPEQMFTDPELASNLTAADLRIAWKAMQYDRMMEAKAKVQPKAPKPAAPPVRPGVATSRSAVEAANRKQAHERLAREGSVEAGAAIWKQFLKG